MLTISGNGHYRGDRTACAMSIPGIIIAEKLSYAELTSRVISIHLFLGSDDGKISKRLDECLRD